MRVLNHIVLHRENLCSIKSAHVVNCKHQVALIEIFEYIVVKEDFLCPEVRVTHGLRVHIKKGAGLHVKVNTTIESVVSQDEIVKGGVKKKVVESLLILVCKQIILNYHVSAVICGIISIAVPSEIKPHSVLIVCHIDVVVHYMRGYWEVALF